jgi:3-oxoacyl-[acyl-carrier-protein] synthase I
MSCSIERVGSVCSLGEFPDDSAAILAGLSGARAEAAFGVFIKGPEGAPMPLCAAPVVSYGFVGIGRMVALLHRALLRLIERPDNRAALGQTPWFVAVPDPADREIDLGDDVSADDAQRVKRLAETVLERTFAAAGVPVGRAPHRFFGGAKTAFGEAVGAALREIEAGTLPRCIVAAVDSLLSPAVLEDLGANNLLKGPDNQYGIVPGEGAALLVLGKSKSITRIEKATLVAKSAQNRERGDGRALARAIAETVSASESSGAIILDHTGERERAIEWGDALVHLTGDGVAARVGIALTPAMSIGETGVAAQALGTVLSSYALARGRADKAAVATSSCFDSGKCSAVLVARD